jgi:hypothetical protein
VNILGSPLATRTRERVIPCTHPRRPRPLGSFVKCAVLVVMSAALLAACDERGVDQTGRPSAGATATSATSAQAGETAQPVTATRLTDSEIKWILAAENLASRLGMAQGQQRGGDLDRDEALKLAAVMRSCRTSLAELGAAPTQRLKPAYDLFVVACNRYNQAAGCLTTIANVPTHVYSESEVRKLNEAGDCVTAAGTEAATRLAQGVQKLEDIKLAG